MYYLTDTSVMLKYLLIRLPFFVRFGSFLTRRSPRIFFYHRFCKLLEKTRDKIDIETFSWQLKNLVNGWSVISLAQFFQMREKGEQLPPYTVVLTADDGYQDFYRYAYPVLKKHGLTATFFPTVNFINGEWFWWDKLNYALDRTQRRTFEFEFSGELFHLGLENLESKGQAWESLADYCLALNHSLKSAFIAQVAQALDVEIPGSPPNEFAPVTWDQLAEMSQNGIEIGSHSLSHAILSRLSKDNLVEELVLSKAAIEKKLGSTVESFCYPNGLEDDINEIVCEEVGNAGYKGAVVSYNHNDVLFDLYRTSRFSASYNKTDFLWKLCGMEMIGFVVRNYLKNMLTPNIALRESSDKNTTSLRDLYRTIQSDFRRYLVLMEHKSFYHILRVIIYTPGIWVTFLYRFGVCLNKKSYHFRILIPVRMIYSYLYFLVCLITGINIPTDTTIGRGLYIGHWGGIVLHPDVVIGDNCNLSNGVTIGEGGRGDNRGVPIIGNRVYVGPGAKIFGDIVIGDDVAIGANAVVVKSIRDSSVVGGVPAVVLSSDGSKDFVIL